MANPELNLILGIIFLLILSGVFWPDYGVVARIRSRRKKREKILKEDALKFLFDCEYKKQPCGLNSIAGNLNVSTDRVSKILDDLRKDKSIDIEGQICRLTASGRIYALKIIRTHRLWERYLADETGVHELRWHSEADRIEHQLNDEELERISRKLGNPIFDPHGDPIPTREGEIPEHKGQILSYLTKGFKGKITHIEDEPHSIYKELVALGIYPGMNLEVIQQEKQNIRISLELQEFDLNQLQANAITVVPLPENTEVDRDLKTLAEVKEGEHAEVVGISPQCRGSQRRRLLDLGIVPGTTISAEFLGPLGDPMAYRIMGASIGLRRKQAELIFVRDIHE
ncbi:MAG TPA: DNA-binding protein [Flavobacteriales bacterium]|jgi:DtxR family Mn-dependent transcriptional regulator|nr:DNA-binding protein [Flavobacteriales bacterium]